MDIDNLDYTKKLDSLGMISHINDLPHQLLLAWQEGLSATLAGLSRPDAVIIAGMGGSAIGADLISGYISDLCSVPVIVHRDYNLPAWAGKNTLVILSSHSGNTEETLSSYATARERGCSIITISTGGELSSQAREAGLSALIFKHVGQPRAAVGFSFGLLLALFQRLGLIPNQTVMLQNTVEIMRHQQLELLPDIPTWKNPAKRLAGQLIGREVVIMGSGCIAPVARRWKGQINELAKTWAQFDILPEADHNTLAGVINPQELLSRSVILFLRAACDYPANRIRADMTREIFMLQGIGTDVVDSIGDHPMANIWSLLHFGDYLAYYLAVAYQVDPGPIEILEDFKRALREMRA
jgi:glucose/mannose-6-phosphate isomerase